MIERAVSPNRGAIAAQFGRMLCHQRPLVLEVELIVVVVASRRRCRCVVRRMARLKRCAMMVIVMMTAAMMMVVVMAAVMVVVVVVVTVMLAHVARCYWRGYVRVDVVVAACCWFA